MKNKLLTVLLLAISATAFAQSEIVTQTKTWKSVPITVNEQTHTYTVEGPMPTEGEYYYTYPGYRCIKERNNIAGVNFLMFHAGISGGHDIYCYPEQ